MQSGKVQAHEVGGFAAEDQKQTFSIQINHTASFYMKCYSSYITDAVYHLFMEGGLLERVMVI